ncbi:hypothetical protein B0H16DRAFT_1517094 [Mycena metata]|uniref:F-box domain-containing protein n=1 Tax=Mycena metata TaxID=1033252 RepID=A0AAD7JQT7_9AGAR|nr:hypothetical protein B0H16DRAFT_1517094 [Mycena metata]
MVSSTLQPLPNELWAEIFTSLPREALGCVYLTSRLFAHIVRPLLFRALEFHPYALVGGYRAVACPPSGLALPILEHIDSDRQRLSYWSSSDIAPLVRVCSVTPWGGLVYRRFSRADDPYVLLTGLFDALPSFTNLCTLALTNVYFTQQQLGNLSLLPNLMALEIEFCGVVRGTAINTTTLAPLPITSFTFAHDASGDNMDHWVPLLPVDKLVHLRLELYRHARFFDQIQAGDDFTGVKSLQISLGRLSLPWTRILSKFPAVESLILDQDFACEIPPHAPISDILPSLREYQGPGALLHFFLASPTLRHIDIPFWYTDCPTGNDILAYFQGFAGPNRITTLHTEFVQFDHVYLAGLGIAFPNLAELHIKVSVRGWNGEAPFEADALFEAMVWHSPLTPNIRKLALHWEYLSDAKPTPNFGCPDVNELKDALVSQHPELKVVWVDGSDTMYLWRRGSDVVQYTDSDDSAEVYSGVFVVRFLEAGLHSK